MQLNLKALKRMAAATCCAVALFSLASCSDDNDGPDHGNSEDANPDNVFHGNIPSIVGGAQIKTNDKGQVSEIKDGSETITFEYGTFTPNRANTYNVLMKIRDTRSADDGSDIYLALNDKGFVSYAYQVYLDPREGTDEWWFGYNSDGQLNYLKRTEGQETYDVTYSGGNISKVVEKEADGDRAEYTVAYTNGSFKSPEPNKGNVMIFDAVGIDMDEMSLAYYAGLLGKATKHLPMGNDEKGFEGGSSYTESETFNWTFNSNGLPTKFWVVGNESDAITFIW